MPPFQKLGLVEDTRQSMGISPRCWGSSPLWDYPVYLSLPLCPSWCLSSSAFPYPLWKSGDRVEVSSLYLMVAQGSAVWLSQATLLPGQVYNLKGRQPQPLLPNFCVPSYLGGR